MANNQQRKVEAFLAERQRQREDASATLSAIAQIPTDNMNGSRPTLNTISGPIVRTNSHSARYHALYRAGMATIIKGGHVLVESIRKNMSASDWSAYRDGMAAAPEQYRTYEMAR